MRAIPFSLVAILLSTACGQLLAQAEGEMEFWRKSIPKWLEMPETASATSSFAGELYFEIEHNDAEELTERILTASKFQLNKRYDQVSIRQSGFKGKVEQRSVVRFVCKKDGLTTVCFLSICLRATETERLVVR